MELSVIIVNYNVRQFLENSLTSVLRAMEGIQGEILVVDNASDDGSAAMVRAKFPQVRLLTNATNLGFARANNIALREASGDFILLINPDTIVQEDTLRVMLRFLRAHPEVGLAGCKILNPDGSFQLPCRRSFPTPWVAFTKIFGLSALFPSSRLFGRYNLTYLDPDRSYPVDAVSGSFMMMTREVCTRVGGLDETFFMYGEDLDLCYRVRQAGYQVYYVHETQIVHFKGESTRRSNVDEVRLFYGAMELFVQKHFSHSRLGVFFLRLGIVLRAAAASLNRVLQPLLFALIDFCLVAGAIILAEWLYFGRVFRFQPYAYPIVWTVPGLLVVVVGACARIYTVHRLAIARSGVVVIVSYFVISAIVFFAKAFAFSRAVVLISGLIAFIVLPGWRLAVRLWGRRGGRSARTRSLFGSRTLIVGAGTAGQEVLKKLRARVDGGYDIMGFIDTSSVRIGETVAGVEVVGSIENVGKVIEEKRITDVIFSADELPYTTILAVIGRSSSRNVSFRLVPTSLEAIIGKTRIDDLDPLPLVQIDYAIHRPFNRIVKRGFDVVLSLGLMMTLYPVVKGLHALRLVRTGNPWLEVASHLGAVLRGSISAVGLPLEEERPPGGATAEGPYLGPRGITGLVQLNRHAGASKEERERYELYYAKNQSVWLDVEILAKALLQLVRR